MLATGQGAQPELSLLSQLHRKKSGEVAEQGHLWGLKRKKKWK
jgi:hypothetical protein